MKLATALFFGLAAFAGYVQADNNEKPTTGQFTRTPGKVVDTSKVNGGMAVKPAKRGTEDGKLITLDLDTISAPINAGDIEQVTHPKRSPGIRGRAPPPITCPSYAPWICEGVTCLDIFTHNCCAGGVVCEDPDVCVRDLIGRVVCHKN